MIRTAPEGRWFIVGAWVIALVLLLAALRFASPGWWIACLLWWALAIWVVAFFRDPERSGQRGECLLLAPADGKVVSVLETDEPAFFGGRALRVSIFMNVFDCHVNRYPTDGVVRYRHYNPGKFGHAAAEKSSLDNEQSSIGLVSQRGKVLIRQIAGLIARRIVTDHQVGTPVKPGRAHGHDPLRIASGPVPSLGTRILVKEGDTTRVGQTVVAEWC